MKKTVTVLVLRRQRYGTARPISAGAIPSRVLPRLRVTVAQIFDLGV